MSTSQHHTGKLVTGKGNVPLWVMAVSVQFIVVCLWLYTLLASSEQTSTHDRLLKPIVIDIDRPSKSKVVESSAASDKAPTSELLDATILINSTPGKGKLRIFSRLISSTKAWKKQFGYSGEVMAFECLKSAVGELGHALVESTLPLPSKLHIPSRWRMAMKAYDPLCKGHWDILLVEYNRLDEAWSHPCVRNGDIRIAVLDFYGHTVERVHRLLRPSNYLTMYPEAENTFLGFYVQRTPVDVAKNRREAVGVIWGKRKEYFTPEVVNALNKALASFPQLVLHATVADKKGRKVTVNGLSAAVKYHGIIQHTEFVELLRASRFVLGLGHPIYGPTAMEALSLGCRYFNFVHKEVFKHPMGSNFTTQHDYLGRLASSYPNHICNFDVYNQPDSLQECIRQALNATQFESFIPEDYQRINYVQRVDHAFSSVPKTKIPINASIPVPTSNTHN